MQGAEGLESFNGYVFDGGRVPFVWWPEDARVQVVPKVGTEEPEWTLVVSAPVRAGETLGLVAGEIRPDDALRTDWNAYMFRPHPDVGYVVDCARVGNVFRHLEDYSDDLADGGESHPNVTLEVARETFGPQHCFALAVVATRDIETGEELETRFGAEYWRLHHRNQRQTKRPREEDAEEVEEYEEEEEEEQEEEKKKEPESHTCDQCNRSLPSARGLRTHKLQTHGNRRSHHLCIFCWHVCTSPVSLTKHTIRMHPDTRHLTTFTCRECGKKFRSKSGLCTHIYEAHLSIAFPCNNCSYVARSSAYLSKHKRSRCKRRIKRR